MKMAALKAARLWGWEDIHIPTAKQVECLNEGPLKGLWNTGNGNMKMKSLDRPDGSSFWKRGGLGCFKME